MKHSERRKIAVIADDFTGALDTGVQFAKRGAKTVTIFDVEKTEQKMAEDDADVYVIDAESRHLEERQAYALVYRIAAVCRRQGTDYIYKKTDSVLRGNIETEIMAVRDAFGGGQVSFLPAYPKMQRYTIDGIQYLGEQPVNETASGKDPFEPVESAVVARLFHRLKTENRKASEGGDFYGDCDVCIYDAQTDEEMELLAGELLGKTDCRIFAGCAGFAGAMAKFFDFSGKKEKMPQLKVPLLVLCGSVNDVSKQQIQEESRNGYHRYRFNEKEWMDQTGGRSVKASLFDTLVRDLETNREILIDTDTVDLDGKKPPAGSRESVAEGLGTLGAAITDSFPEILVMVIGGDTVISYLQKLKCGGIRIMGEIADGAVLSKAETENNSVWMISKSGGFGEISMIHEMKQRIGVTDS